MNGRRARSNGSDLTPQGQAARAGVEGGAASITDNDPYFKALQAEMADKGFIVASAESLVQLGPYRLLDVDDLRPGLLRRRNDAGLDAAL